MKKIVLIACASQKLSKETRAENIYISSLFKYNLRFAKSLNPDKIFILSAKYGLLNLDKIIKPYNETLNKMSLNVVKKWADQVIVDLGKLTELNDDEFIILAGERYRKYLISDIKKYKIPLEGLSIGRQLHYLKTELKKFTPHK